MIPAVVYTKYKNRLSILAIATSPDVSCRGEHKILPRFHPDLAER